MYKAILKLKKDKHSYLIKSLENFKYSHENLKFWKFWNNNFKNKQSKHKLVNGYNNNSDNANSFANYYSNLSSPENPINYMYKLKKF